MSLKLEKKSKSFIDRNNNVVDYNYYYVVLSNGIEIQLKPNDATAKQLLDLETFE